MDQLDAPTALRNDLAAVLKTVEGLLVSRFKSRSADFTALNPIAIVTPWSASPMTPSSLDSLSLSASIARAIWLKRSMRLEASIGVTGVSRAALFSQHGTSRHRTGAPSSDCNSSSRCMSVIEAPAISNEVQ